MARAGRAGDVDRVVDHDTALRAARAGVETCGELGLGDADRLGRQRSHQPVRDPVEERRQPRVRGERPAVDGEETDRHPGRDCGEATEHSGLRAARVQYLRPLTAQERYELEQAGEISQWIDRPAYMPQGDEARADACRDIAERALAVGGEHDVVPLGDCREQRGHVGLSAAHLGQSDHQQDSWTRRRVRHGAERTEGLRPFPMSKIALSWPAEAP